MEELKTKNEYLKATNADGLCILEATTTWCTQCKAIAPFVDKMVKQYPDARFYKYDTDDALDISQELGISHMPTFHIFKDGEVVDSITGAKAKELEKVIKDNYDGKVEE